MKSVLIVALGSLLLLSLGFLADTAAAGEKEGDKAEEIKAEGTEDVAVIETRFGKITFRFFTEDAPKTVENFEKLAASGFYNGTTFHRVIPGFVIQGGDPNTRDDGRSNDGMGGPGYTIPAEFNSHKHLRGTVAMARGADPNSAGSQFYICVAPQPGLDGKYTVFGQVVEGMNVVDKVVRVKTDPRDNPIEPVVMETVSIEKHPKK